MKKLLLILLIATSYSKAFAETNYTYVKIPSHKHNEASYQRA